MRNSSRLFVFLVFTCLFAAYAPITQAEMQPQAYGNADTAPVTQADESQQRSYGGKVGNKALNAVANLSTSVLEIPKNIINTSNESNIVYGAVGGLIKGLINTAGRLGAGIADIITIPLPTKPIAQPSYIWNDFDVDTSYGPAFRIDSTPEQEEPPVVESPPSPEPVVAAPVTPKPEPIDNSRQYREETNQKLDTLFKKEMKK